MKTARFQSDYSSCNLNLVQTDDGDIAINIFGEGECRIATSGGKLHGDTLVKVVSKFSEIIDLLNGELTEELN